MRQLRLAEAQGKVESLFADWKPRDLEPIPELKVLSGSSHMSTIAAKRTSPWPMTVCPIPIPNIIMVVDWSGS